MGTWIDAKERTPPPRQEVLVCIEARLSKKRYQSIGLYVPENWYKDEAEYLWMMEKADYRWEWDTVHNHYANSGWYVVSYDTLKGDHYAVWAQDEVTHWMPLPASPEIGENDGLD